MICALAFATLALAGEVGLTEPEPPSETPPTVPVEPPAAEQTPPVAPSTPPPAAEQTPPAAPSTPPPEMVYAPPGVPGPHDLGFPIRRRGNVGVGVVLGVWVTGLNVEAMIDDHNAFGVVFGAVTSPMTYEAPYDVSICADWTWHPDVLVENDTVALRWHLGLALSAELGSGSRVAVGLGLRAIGGLGLELKRVPIDFSLQYRPGIIAEVRPRPGLGYAYGDVVFLTRWWLR
jgi:hypothetical protein